MIVDPFASSTPHLRDRPGTVAGCGTAGEAEGRAASRAAREHRAEPTDTHRFEYRYKTFWHNKR